eukprot:5542824-Pleurochrysis_carterae.AAC.2
MQKLSILSTSFTGWRLASVWLPAPQIHPCVQLAAHRGGRQVIARLPCHGSTPMQSMQRSQVQNRWFRCVPQRHCRPCPRLRWGSLRRSRSRSRQPWRPSLVVGSAQRPAPSARVPRALAADARGAISSRRARAASRGRAVRTPHGAPPTPRAGAPRCSSARGRTPSSASAWQAARSSGGTARSSSRR